MEDTTNIIDYFGDDYDKAEAEKERQDWHEYWTALDAEDRKEDEEKKTAIKKAAYEKRRTDFLFDFSGDDLSIMPSMQ